MMLIGTVQFIEGIAWLRAVPPSGVVGPLLFAVSGTLVGSLGILFFAGAQAGLHTLEVLHMGGLILARTGTLPQKWQEAHQAYYCSRVGVKALAHLHGVPMGQLIEPIRDAWAGPV